MDLAAHFDAVFTERRVSVYSICKGCILTVLCVFILGLSLAVEDQPAATCGPLGSGPRHFWAPALTKYDIL